MKLQTLNFAALGPGPFEANTSSNLVAVVGSNGSGKSTMVDAIYFALTGEPLSSKKIEDLITWGCSSAQVELQLGDVFISRTITKGQPSKVSFRRGDIKLTKKAEVDEAVLSCFGISDKSAFRQVYFSEQFNAVDILNGPDSTRLQMLTGLFGLAKFERMRSKIADVSEGLFTSAIDAAIIESLQNSLYEATVERSDLQSQVKEASIDILSKESLEAANKLANQKTTEELEQLKKDLEADMTSMASLEAAVKDLPAPPDADKAEAYGKAVRLRELVPQFEKAREALEELKPISPSCSSISDMRRKMCSEIAKVEARIEQLQNNLQLAKNGKCPITGGFPCADLAAMTNQDKVNLEVSGLLQKKVAIEKDITEIDSLFEDARKRELESAEIRASFTKLKEIVDPLLQYSTFDVDGYKDEIEAHTASEGKRKLLYEQLGNVKQDILRKQLQLDQMNTEGTVDAVRVANAKKLLEDHNKAVAQMPILQQQAEAAAKRLSAAEAQLHDADTQNLRAKKGIFIKDFLSKARNILHKDNLPRQLIDAVKDELNTRQERFLQLFNFPYTVQWMSGGSLMYTNDIGELTQVSALSGGQKYVLLLAIRCAMAEFLHADFPLMVLDEPTTGLDAANRDLLATVLNTVSDSLSASGLTIIVPTHDATLLTNADIVDVQK